MRLPIDQSTRQSITLGLSRPHSVDDGISSLASQSFFYQLPANATLPFF